MRWTIPAACVPMFLASCTTTPDMAAPSATVARSDSDSGFRLAAAEPQSQMPPQQTAAATPAALPDAALTDAALPDVAPTSKSVARNVPESGFRLVAAEPQPQKPATKAAASAPAASIVAVEGTTPPGAPADVRHATWQGTTPPAPPAPAPVDDGAAMPPAPANGPAPLDPAPAANASGLTLDAAIGMAIAANPTLGSAQHAVQRSQGEWTQVGLYPNPVVGYMASEIGQDDQVGQQGIYAQQMIPLGDKLRLNRAVSSGDIAVARAAADAQRLRVQTDTQTRFYEALGAQEIVEIALRTEQYGEKSLEATRRLEEAGESTKADVLLAVTSYQQLRVARQQAEARAEAAWRQLAVMMGRPEMAPMPLVGELETARRPDDFELLWQRVRSTSPELQAASARVARARSRIAREQATVIPDIDAQLAIQQDASTNHTVGSAQIGFMLPVHQKNQGAIAAAQAEYCRQVKEYERIELDLRDRLVAAVRDAEVAARQVETYGESIVPAADEGLSLIRQGYEGGEFNVLRLVTAQQTYADSLREYVQAQTDLQQALAVLDGVLLTGGLEQPTAPQGVDTPDSLTEIPKAQ